MLSNLGDLGKITLSTSGPPEPDHSLLNHPEFWEVATAQHASSKPSSNTTYVEDVQVYLFGDFFCIAFDQYIVSVLDSQFFRYLDSMAAKAHGMLFYKSMIR